MPREHAVGRGELRADAGWPELLDMIAPGAGAMVATDLPDIRHKYDLLVEVQTDKVKAGYRDGVLTVRLPKAEEVKPRQIKIDLL